MNGRDRVFVALDSPDADRATALIRALSGAVGGFKIGLQLFTACGPWIVERARDEGAPVFLDLKLHDIPNTVGEAAASAARLGVSFLTVHASGGETMIRAAVDQSAEAAEATGNPPPTVLAVTILTSMRDADLEQVGMAGPCSAAVPRLAAVARDAGAGGAVCSPLEVEAVRGVFPDGRLVVPGIRPTGSAAGDQARIATPAAAVASGADHLVIGRPITQAPDPRAAAVSIAAEIDNR